MKIEQLYYTRLDEGWGIVAATDGATDAMKSSFSTLCAANPADKVVYSFDANKSGFYLAQSVPAGLDPLGREKKFAHGYVFSTLDEVELLTNYKGILGISSFSENANVPMSSLTDLPVNAIYSTFNINIHNLMEAAYEVLLCNKSLDIVLSEGDAIAAIKEIMNVVYSYLPLSLRKYSSFASAKGGLIRKFTLVKPDEASSEIVYDIATGEVRGITGEYERLISALLLNPQEILNAIQAHVELQYIDDLTMKAVFDAAFEYAILKSDASASCDVSDDEIISQLITLLSGGNVNNVATATRGAVLVNKIVDKRIPVSETINSLIVDSYMKTNNQELKRSISKYIAYTYTIRCGEVDFAKFQELKLADFELYKEVACNAIKNNSEEFIARFALATLEDGVHSAFLTEQCSEECLKIVADHIVHKINDSEDGREILLKILDKTLHKSAIDLFVSFKPSKDLLWAYLENVFKAESRWNHFLKLNNETVIAIASFIVSECDENTEKVQMVLKETRIASLKHYNYFEQALAMNRKYCALDRLYAFVLLDEATCTRHITELHEKLSSYTQETPLFSREALYKFVDFAKQECFDAIEATSLIARTRKFVGSIGENPERYVKQVKMQFWSAFKFDSWDPKDDYTELIIAEEYNSMYENEAKAVAASSNVAILSRLVAVLGKTEFETSEFVKTCLLLLGDEGSDLKPVERDKIIKKLKDAFVSDSLSNRTRRGGYPSGAKREHIDMNMDLYLLLHYSNVSEEIDASIRINNAKDVSEYLRTCVSCGGTHMIDDAKVILGLYQVLNERAKSSTQKRDYKEALQLLEEYIKERLNDKTRKLVEKEIRKINDRFDLSWIPSVAMLAICAVLFSAVGGISITWLAIMLRGLITAVGLSVAFCDSVIEACCASDSQNKYAVLSFSFFREVLLLATLLIAFYNIF